MCSERTFCFLMNTILGCKRSSHFKIPKSYIELHALLLIRMVRSIHTIHSKIVYVYVISRTHDVRHRISLGMTCLDTNAA